MTACRLYTLVNIFSRTTTHSTYTYSKRSAARFPGYGSRLNDSSLSFWYSCFFLPFFWKIQVGAQEDGRKKALMMKTGFALARIRNYAQWTLLYLSTVVRASECGKSYRCAFFSRKLKRGVSLETVKIYQRVNQRVSLAETVENWSITFRRNVKIFASFNCRTTTSCRK